jgi:lipopolysaccharide biosynthesis regulator YciM/uncharacterized protein HemY
MASAPFDAGDTLEGDLTVEGPRDTETARAGPGPLGLAIEVLAAELEEAGDAEAAAALGHVLLLGLGDPLAARRWLDRAAAAAEGFRGLLLCALAAEDRAGLVQLEGELARVRGDRGALARDLAEIWLYHRRDPAAAARVLASGGAGRSELRLVALELAGESAELEAELAAGDAADLVRAAAVAWDQSRDAGAVIDLAAAAGAGLELLEVALEAAATTGDDATELEILRRASDLVSERHPGSAAAPALRYLLGERLAAAGRHREAAEVFAPIRAPGFGRYLALRARLRCAAADDDVEALAAVRLELAAGEGELAAIHRRRAAQLGAGGSDALWRRLLTADAADREARCALECSGFRGGPSHQLATLRWLAERAESGGGRIWRGAAALAEATGELELAAELAERAVEANPASELGSLHRLWLLGVRRERPPAPGAIASGLAGWLEAAADPAPAVLAGAAAIAAAAGATDLTARIAARITGDRRVALAVTGAAFAADRRWSELAGVWRELLAGLEAPRARARLALDLARLLLEHLGELEAAGEAVATAAEAGAPPAEVAILEAAVHRAAGEPADARAALAAALAGLETETGYRDPAAAHIALLDLAELELEVGGAAAAADHLEAARPLAPRHPRTLDLGEAVARARGDRSTLLAALADRLENAGEPDDRLALAREIASLRAEAGGPEDALAAWRRVLDLEPGDAAALAAVSELAGGAGRWELVAEVFERAPDSAENLAFRCRALRQLERWDDLAAALRARLEITREADERAAVATELARLYEEQLEDPEAAASLRDEAGEYRAEEPVEPAALIAVLDAQGDWEQLARALRAEIDGEPAGSERHLELSSRLARLLADELGRPADAAAALEEAVAAAAEPGPALAALEAIYEQLEARDRLLPVLERRARSGGGANSWRRIAELRAAESDIDGALAALGEAWSVDPADAETAAAIERLCREHHRFAALARHHQRVVDHLGEDQPEERAAALARKGEIELRHLGAIGAALASLTAAVELAPEAGEHFDLAAALCTRERRWDLLADLCELRAARLSGSERLALLRRAAEIASRRLNDLERVRRLDDELLDEGELDPEILGAIEERCAAAEDWERLAAVLERQLAQARGGEDTIALLERTAALAAEKLLDEQRAVAHYLRILEIAPAHRPTLEALARIFESTDQWSEFLEITRRLIRITEDPEEVAVLHFKCGSVMEARFEDDERAIEYYAAALHASQRCLPAIHGLRDLHRRRGDWDRVIETLELEIKLWKEPRERAAIFAQIGKIYAEELGAEARALGYFESALAVDPDSLPANLALFEHYFATGDWGRALPMAEAMARKAVRSGDPTTRSEFYRRRGVVLRHSGQVIEAADSILLALEIDPGNLHAVDALLELASEDRGAYDFASVFGELETLYRRRAGDPALLARVLVGRARLATAAGDLDAAEELLAEACELTPREVAIARAVVDHHLDRLRVEAALEALALLEEAGAGADDVRWARLRRARIHADVAMDPEAACALWTRVLEDDPECLEALYRLAQERLLVGDRAGAIEVIGRAIEVAAAPGATVPAAELARYYHLLGRAQEDGDEERAAAAFRRAADYDPSYAEPAVALARRAMRHGDRDVAQTLLVSTAHQAMATRGRAGAVPLQRELGRIFAAAGERAAAAEAYRGILSVVPDPLDRVALAEIHAEVRPDRAAAELEELFATDAHLGPAYKLAASLYDRSGEPLRALRALAAMDAMGMADDADRQEIERRRGELPARSPQRPLSARQRGQLAAGSPEPSFDRVYLEIAPLLAERFPLERPGAELIPLPRLGDRGAAAARTDVELALGGELELVVGRGVPGGIVATTYPRPWAAIDLELIRRGGGELRFALGWTYEVVFRRLGPVLTGPRRRREEVLELMATLIGGLDSPSIRALRSALPLGLQRQLQPRTTAAADVERWASHIRQVPRRAGLLFTDDVRAAAAVLQRLAGHPVLDPPLLSDRGGEAADLVGYYLGTPHHQLCAALSRGEAVR